MISFPRTVLPLVATLALSHGASAALIANWDFSTGTSSDLVSSVGGYTLQAVEDVGGVTFNPGAVSLTQNAGLWTQGINSTLFPSLQTNATLYARIRLDSTPATMGGFILALVDATTVASADFFQQSLTAYSYFNQDLGVLQLAAYGFTTNGHSNLDSGFAGGAGLPSVGDYFNIAVVMSGGNTWRLNINGIDIASYTVSTATSMQAFQSLAFGRIKNSNGLAAMTYDTVQLYDTALTAAQIAAIPEPSTVAILAVSGFFLLGVVRHKARRLKT